MRTLSLLVGLSLLGTVLAVLPDASAAGTCTSLMNAYTYPDCPHLFCYGYWWSYPDPYVTCQYWVDVPPICSRICDPVLA